MMRNLIWTALLGAVLFSCSGSGGSDNFADTADTLTFHASYLTMAELPDGTVVADIADPWNKDARLARYLFVDRDSAIPDSLPAGAKIIRTPVERAAVFSSVHTGAMEELGVIDALKAVADVAYFPDGDTVKSLVANSAVADIGNSQNPSAEILVSVRPEVLLRSPMQGITAAQLPAGIIPVECADYMEDTPIGRAEWLLFFGELFGKRDEAREIFDGVIDEYNSLAVKAAAASSPKPKLLVETETSGVWYVPAGESYAARLYSDAGADYPWANTAGQGSLALSLEEVASKALDADVWLVRSFGYETTSRTLCALNPRYESFKALKDGNIYSCDTQKRNIFSEVPFHPERLLADYIAIFHPEVMPDYETKYFRK